MLKIGKTIIYQNTKIIMQDISSSVSLDCSLSYYINCYTTAGWSRMQPMRPFLAALKKLWHTHHLLLLQQSFYLLTALFWLLREAGMMQ